MGNGEVGGVKFGDCLNFHELGKGYHLVKDPNPLLAVAINYERYGWCVIPLYGRLKNGKCECGKRACPHPGKHPRIMWKEFQTRASTEKEVREWWKTWPKANIGIVCGRVSCGLGVLDIDDVDLAKKIKQFYSDQSRFDPESPCSLVETPSGGVHVYVSGSVGDNYERWNTSGPLIPGVADFKGVGGYVVAPPSPGYKWIDKVGIVMGDKNWAMSFLKKVNPTDTKGESELPSLEDDDESSEEDPERVTFQTPIPEGARNTALTSLAGTLRRRGINTEAIQAMLMVANQELCESPLPETEITTIAQSIGKRPINSTTPPHIYDVREVELQLVCLGEIDEPGPRVDLVEGLVPEGHVAVFYGDGGQGKSYVALAVGMCVAVGRPFVELAVVPGPVLYVDWELDKEEHARRAYRLARGLGLERPPKNLWYLRADKPLPHLIPAIRKIIEARKIRLLLVDSLGPASGDDPESARAVIPMLTALRQLKVSTLAVDHQAKMQHGHQYESKTPFGSAYKFNLARSVIQARLVERSMGTISSMLEHKKSNFGPLSHPIGLRISFTGEHLVTIERVDPKKDPAFLSCLKAEDKIIQSLEEAGQATVAELAERTSIKPDTVGNAIYKLKKQGKVFEAGKEGHAPIYEAFGQAKEKLRKIVDESHPKPKKKAGN